MPRPYGDVGFNKPEAFPTEELFNRHFRKPEKSSGHRQKRHHNRKENICMTCDLPTHEPPLDHERRRKKSNKFQHCPSCNCQPDFNKYERYVESMAMLEKYENYLANPQNSTMKRSKSPFSLPSGIHSRMTGGIPSFKRGQTSEQNQSSKTEYPEEMCTMFMDMINSGVADENAEFFDKSSYAKEHGREDGQLQYNEEDTELDSDCSKKSFRDYCHLKREKKSCSEKIRESIEKCDIARDEEPRQASRDCEEHNHVTVDSKQIKSRKGSDSQKKKTKFDKSAITRPNEISPDRKGMNQRHKIEPSTSCHSLPKDDNDSDNDSEMDFSKQSQLQHEFKGNGNSKISRRSTVDNLQTEKSERNNIEIMSLAKEEALNEDRKSLYAGGDLDLHTCKSYIVDLIDRALSKQLRTQLGEKKVDLDKNSASWQEMCFEVTRALQRDYCQPFTQNLYNFQENMDNVKLLKRFRWAYVKHIQEQLRSLEKIIDICSPRHTEKESATS